MRAILFTLLIGVALPGAFISIHGNWARAQTELEDRVVFLIGNLPDQSLISLTANLASWDDRAVLLLDSPNLSLQQRSFLEAYQPDRVIAVRSIQESKSDLEKRPGLKVASVPITGGPPLALWKELFPRADRVILCPAEPRLQLLQASCLAGALGSPLFMLTGQPGEEAIFRQQLSTWKAQKIYAVGECGKLCHDLKNIKIVRLPNAEAVAGAHRLHLKQRGPIENLVVANPTDGPRGLTGMAALAPWIAIQHRAALLLTNEKGDDAGMIIREALRSPDLRRVDSMLLVGDLNAIPMERRPNPVAGKDQFIEMEPMTPTGTEPFTLATGRLFADDRALVPLMLARQKLLASKTSGLKALVVSNPSGGLPLLETFSRNTAKELGNTGYQTTALFNRDVNPDQIRQFMSNQDIFL
jgi:hypothetical protein